MKSITVLFRILLVVIAIVLISNCSFSEKDSSKLSEREISILNTKASKLSVGFSAITITPEVPDRWTDINEDAQYNPKNGDTFIDGNGNGVFDPVWIAGFDNRRAANGIHDDLWARTMVVDDGTSRLAIVSLDVIGFMNNCVNNVREILSEDAGITYLIVTSTHTHEGPDLLGLWGEKATRSGVNKSYLDYVIQQVAASVEEAAKQIRPATLEISEDLSGAIPLVRDSRKPEVLDAGLRIIKVTDNEDGKTLGSLISWGNHPETLWGKNLLITSDFAHYLRDGVENGIRRGDSLLIPGTGGVAVYVTGAIGGLMTTSPSLSIIDPFTGDEYKAPTFEKAQSQGTILATLVLSAMKKPLLSIDSASISLVVRNVDLPLSNKLFKLAKIIGVLDRGKSGIKNMSTEVAAFKIDQLSFITLPGEVYPEIVNGGIESPERNDFNITPVEIPPLRNLMPGKYKFVFGLANDEIGYIIPKSQWDTKSPFTYERDSAPYGEENSIGPETAPMLHNILKSMLLELK